MSLKHAILAVLSHSDRTGYELTRKMDDSVAYFWPATHQQIYQELKKLNEAKFVSFREKEQSGKPDKKIYSITRAGTKELVEWIGQPADVAPSKDQLLIKLFASHLVDRKTIENEMTRLKTIHEGKLTEYLNIEREHFSNKKIPPRLLAQYLTLRKGILFERSWLAWCAECLGKIALVLGFLIPAVASADDSCRLALAQYGTRQALRTEILRHATDPRTRLFTRGDDVAVLYPVEAFEAARTADYVGGIDDEMVRLLGRRSDGLWSTGRWMFGNLLLGGLWTWMAFTARAHPAPEAVMIKWSVTSLFGIFLVGSVVQFTRYFTMPLMPAFANQIGFRTAAAGAEANSRHTVALVGVAANRIEALGDQLRIAGWRPGFWETLEDPETARPDRPSTGIQVDRSRFRTR